MDQTSHSSPRLARSRREIEDDDDDGVVQAAAALVGFGDKVEDDDDDERESCFRGVAEAPVRDVR